MNYRISLTGGECVEIRRALDLIIQEDESADVNVDEQSRTDKREALKKFDKLLRVKPNAESGVSVDVRTGALHKRPGTGPA